MRTKILALVTTAFVAYVILTADAGAMPEFIRSLYDFPNGDRVGHVAIYGGLALILSLAFKKKITIGRFSVAVAVIGLLTFAAIEELSQTLFVSRTADVIDLLCSVIGVVVGAAIGETWMRGREMLLADKKRT